ncbi:MAG TPA: DUF5681 domain-containing protein [Beijerinckiaceae bacterium]|nr:DUF5681 domain-containing protein [Beijerinckiaceae bacterium]
MLDHEPGVPGAGYEVGYRKPPVSGQFRPGRSGNPKGRRKGSKGFKAIVLGILREKVSVGENGKRRKVTRLEAAALSLSNAIIVKQDLKAASALTQLVNLCGLLEDPREAGAEAISEHELTQIQKLLDQAGVPA